jgi:hypothetical protein
MMYVLIEHSNRGKAGELTFLKVSSDVQALREYAARLHACWLTDRKAGLRAGGAQLLIAPCERVVVDDAGIKVEWSDCECPVDDMLVYVDWCDSHGISLVEEHGAAFH